MPHWIKRETAAKAFGGLLGAAFVGWFFIAQPMLENYQRGGCVFLECGQK